jgi:hypothetical protein
MRIDLKDDVEASSGARLPAEDSAGIEVRPLG